MSKVLTLVVPTFKGLDHLFVLCKCLNRQDFTGKLGTVISDENFNADSFCSYLYLTFIHSPDIGILGAIRIGFNSEKSKFCQYTHKLVH